MIVLEKLVNITTVYGEKIENFPPRSLVELDAYVLVIASLFLLFVFIVLALPFVVPQILCHILFYPHEHEVITFVEDTLGVPIQFAWWCVLVITICLLSTGCKGL